MKTISRRITLISHTIILISLLVSLICIYFMGKKIENEFKKQLLSLQSTGVEVELISYKRHFFTAEIATKISIPIAGQNPLSLSINSDVVHYPYKAVATNHFLLTDKNLERDLNDFFQRTDWLVSTQEINLLGVVNGRFALTAGYFDHTLGEINIAPLTFNYSYDVNKQKGGFNFFLPGFKGEVENAQVTFNGLLVNATFALIDNSQLVDYQYQVQLDEMDFREAVKHISLNDVDLQGVNRVAQDKLTVDSENNWQVAHFRNDQREFTNNHIQLFFNELNSAALITFKDNLYQHNSIQESFNDLISLGVKVDLQNLYSETPWGEVNASLEMDIQRSIALKNVIDEPFTLIDYTNGYLNLSLPERLKNQTDVGGFVEMGLMSGVLRKEQQRLTLESTLDTGELMINGRIIPL